MRPKGSVLAVPLPIGLLTYGPMDGSDWLGKLARLQGWLVRALGSVMSGADLNGWRDEWMMHSTVNGRGGWCAILLGVQINWPIQPLPDAGQSPTVWLAAYLRMRD